MKPDFRILFLYPNEHLLNPPPVSIGLLTALLRKEGFKVDVFDNTFYKLHDLSSDKAKEDNLQVKPFNFQERGIQINKNDMYEDLRQKVIKFKPNLIALSALEGTYNMGIKMLDAVNEYNVPVIAGGVFPTAAPEFVLSNPNISFVCLGEGETALLELCNALSLGRDHTRINNLWIKKDGKIIKNGLSKVIDLNSLPIPDYSVFDEQRFYRPMAGKIYRTIPVETNRGCPFKCTFCNSPSTMKFYKDNNAGNFFRKKKIKNIYSELKTLINRWDAEYVYFPSDTFLAMSEHEFDEFIEMYSEFKLPFWIQTRPETITIKRAKKLRKVGCHRMSIGLEHGNPEFRKVILKKEFKNDVFINAARIIDKAGIPLTVNNIIGFPYETRELIFDTIELNRQIKFDSCNAYAFFPFKGTNLYDICIKEGYLKEATATTRGCLTLDPILDMPQLSRNEIKGLMRTFVLYATMPKKHWRFIRVAERLNKEGNKMFKKLKNIYYEKYI